MKVVVLARRITPMVQAVARAYPDAVVILERRPDPLARRWKRLRFHLASLRPGMVLQPLVALRILRDNLGRRLRPDARPELPADRVRHVPDHNGPECEALLTALRPDVIVVQATRVLKPHVFEKARLGAVNFHKGLLPYWRGSEIPFWALYEGADQGFTIHRVDAGIDTGAILWQETVATRPDDDPESIRRRMEELGAPRMLEVLAALERGTATSRPQAPAGPMFKRYTLADRFELERRLARRRRDRR